MVGLNSTPTKMATATADVKEISVGSTEAVIKDLITNATTSAAAYYEYFLSFSADFASGKPNPIGSGYHWSLQHSRFPLSQAFYDKITGGGKVNK